MKNAMKSQNRISKLLLLTCSLILAFLIGSCDPTDVLKLDNSCDNNWAKEVQNELNAYSDALNAWAADATTGNCNAVKKTGNAYIDALKKVEKCVPALSKTDWKKALEESRTQINENNCE